MAIFCFINWIVTAETIEGGNYSRKETICRNTVDLFSVKSLINLLVSIFLRFAQVEQPCDTTKSTTMERGHENQAIQGQG